MAKLLFVAQPAMGHMNSLFTIAGKMKAKGHEIHFSCPAVKKAEDAIKANEFDYIKVRPALSSIGLFFLPLFSGYAETYFAMKQFFSGLDHYSSVYKQILEELRPDAVIADFSYIGPCLAAELLQIPYVVIYHAGLCFSGPGIPPFGSGLEIDGDWGQQGEKYITKNARLEKAIDKKISKTRKKLGLPEGMQTYATSPASPWLTLVTTSDAIEAPRHEMSPTTFFIGPCFAGRKNIQQPNFPFSDISTEKPVIYVSLGTVFNKKPKVFKKLIDAFSHGKYQLIVSAGEAFEKLKAMNLQSHVLLFQQVPQVDLLPKVDAVISHGGNNTVNETLAAGKPLIVMPVGGEQGDNASKIVYLGCGLRADMKNFTSAEINDKMEQLLTGDQFKGAAKQACEALSKTDGSITAIKFIEYLMENKKPVIRPEGYPLTVEKDSPLP